MSSASPCAPPMLSSHRPNTSNVRSEPQLAATRTPRKNGWNPHSAACLRVRTTKTGAHGTQGAMGRTGGSGRGGGGGGGGGRGGRGIGGGLSKTDAFWESIRTENLKVSHSQHRWCDLHAHDHDHAFRCTHAAAHALISGMASTVQSHALLTQARVSLAFQCELAVDSGWHKICGSWSVWQHGLTVHRTPPITHARSQLCLSARKWPVVFECI